MLTIKRLLVPVDFSNTSTKALTAAVDLAKVLGAEIKVVHVHYQQIPAIASMAAYIPQIDESTILEEFEKELDKLVKKYGEGVKISHQVHAGDPRTEIPLLADEYKADMIVMGTHGRSGLSHLLMGSVTESVLHQTGIPVLSIKHAS